MRSSAVVPRKPLSMNRTSLKPVTLQMPLRERSRRHANHAPLTRILVGNAPGRPVSPPLTSDVLTFGWYEYRYYLHGPYIQASEEQILVCELLRLVWQTPQSANFCRIPRICSSYRRSFLPHAVQEYLHRRGGDLFAPRRAVRASRLRERPVTIGVEGTDKQLGTE